MVDSPRIFVGNDLELLAGGLLASYVTGTAIQVNGKPWHPPAKLVAELFGDDWTRPEAKPADDEVVEPGYRRAVARKVAFCIDAAGEILDRLRLETADIADAIARSSEAPDGVEPIRQGKNSSAGGLPGGIGEFPRGNDASALSAQFKSNLEASPPTSPASSPDASPDSPGSADSAPTADELARAATALPPLEQLSGDDDADDELTQSEKE